MTESDNAISLPRRVAGWGVHLFTATGAVFALLTLHAIHQEQYILAFWLMAVAVFVDAVDGTLARLVNIKVAVPEIDGALLDNILDYANYVLIPAFFLLESGLLPPAWRWLGATVVVLSSAYQFTQHDAKTKDHFFKGFPSYWNIVVFYLFFWQTRPLTNLIIILVLAVMVFVPIKYVYPSRLDYLTRNRWLRRAMLLATVIWGIATAMLISVYPDTNRLLVVLSLGYVLFYMAVSLYRTFVPLEGSLQETDRRNRQERRKNR
jgi:phosphatidylcholine synthase